MNPKGASNFKNDKYYMGIGYRCVGCMKNRKDNIDTENHILNCEAYKDL